jgi:hypothetical protein
MRFIESKIDPSYSFYSLSKAEQDCIDTIIEHPEVARDDVRWAELAGRSVKSVKRFKKNNPQILAASIEYATKKYFFEIWASLIRRARKDEDVKGKELFFKALRILKEEAPPEILQIFNISNTYNQQNVISDSDIEKILSGHNPLEALKP